MSHTRMQSYPRIGLRIGAIALAVFLSGCAANKPLVPENHQLEREAVAGTEKPAPQPQPLNTNLNNGQAAPAVASITPGTGEFVRPTGPARPHRPASGAGAVTFNFENQPVQAVVKAILGDLLHENYTIVPGVQGNISFSTSEPVDSSQAMPILETLLSWTHNALVKTDGRYVVMPEKDAVAGNVAPSLGAAAPSGGMQARLFPLHYIAADQMQKLLKPFARPDSILLVDNARNVMVVSGTPDELDNYSRTIRTFDVDWLRGMSVGVFNLQHATVEDLMPQLDGMFGPKGDTPLAGMFRFIPIKRTNALVVISTQPSYLTEISNWITKIDLGGGNEPQLYVYDVRNIGAADLAHYLSQIYTDNSGGSSDRGGAVAPGAGGATTLGVGNNGSGNGSGMGSTAGGFGNSTTGTGGLSNGLSGGGLGGTGGNSYGGLGSSSSSSGGIGGGTAVNGVGMNGGLSNSPLAYGGGKLVGAYDQSGLTTDGKVAGTIAAVAADTTLTTPIDQAALATRLGALSPAGGAPTIAWVVTAAPGAKLAVATGVQLDTGSVAMADTTISSTYGNPFATTRMWPSVFSVTANSSRTYMMTTSGPSPVAVSLASSINEVVSAATADASFGAPLVGGVTLGGTALSTDGVPVAIDATKPAVLAFTAETGVGTPALYTAALDELVPSADGLTVDRVPVLVASSKTAGFRLPADKLVVGHTYVVRIACTVGGYPTVAVGDLRERGLPMTTASVTPGVFTVMAP